MYTKLQMILGVVTGVALAIFFIAMIAASKVMAAPANPAAVPGWVGIIGWGTFGVMVLSCIAVMVTLVLDERRLNRPQHEDEPEKPEEPEGEALSSEVPSEEPHEPSHEELHEEPELHEGAEGEHAEVATSTVTETEAFESLEPLEGFSEEEAKE
jgi:hypothetical protein